MFGIGENKLDKYVYKMRKGNLEYERIGVGSLALALLDALDLPLEVFIQNYNIGFGEELYNKLKELGY